MTSFKQCKSCKGLKPLKLYYKQTKCKDGYRTWCKDCTDSKRKIYYLKNQELILEKARKYTSKHPDKVKAATKKYKQNNSDKILAINAKRRASQLQRTPAWLTESHLEVIRSFYSLTKHLKKITGKIYHVDHVIPLMGKNVCGLHVPWNLQVILSTDNCKKNNKTEGLLFW